MNVTEKCLFLSTFHPKNVIKYFLKYEGEKTKETEIYRRTFMKLSRSHYQQR